MAGKRRTNEQSESNRKKTAAYQAGGGNSKYALKVKQNGKFQYSQQYIDWFNRVVAPLKGGR